MLDEFVYVIGSYRWRFSNRMACVIGDVTSILLIRPCLSINENKSCDFDWKKIVNLGKCSIANWNTIEFVDRRHWL